MIDFVCMADHRYVKWLTLSIPTIRAAHPQSRIFVFDLSPENPALIEYCQEFKEIIVVPFAEDDWRWPEWIDKADFSFFWPLFTLRESLKYWGRRLRTIVSGHPKEDWMIDKKAYVAKMQQFCRIVSLKPHVLEKALRLTDHDIVFIDADAVVQKPVELAFEKQFDLGVTCEEPDDVVVGPNPAECIDRPSYPIRAVNTGVVFLRNNAAAHSILKDWVGEMEQVLDVCTEQTALANLIMRKSDSFFTKPGSCQTISADDSNLVRIANLPMRIFNSISINPNMDRLPQNVYISHFVGSMKKDKYWDRVNALVEKSIDKNRTTDQPSDEFAEQTSSFAR